MFVAKTFQETHHGGFVVLHFAVLEAAFEGFLGKSGTLQLHLGELLAYLGACLGGNGYVEPVAFGCLVGIGQDFHLVTALQLGSHRHILAIHTPTGTTAAYIRMNAVGKVEHGSTLGQLEQVALGGEDKDFVTIEIDLELIDQLFIAGGRGFESRTDVLEPFLQFRSAVLHTLVTPMGSQTSLGNLVHTLGTNLHFHPFALRPHDGDVQAFVAVGFGHTQPVAHPLGIGSIHVGNDGEDLPAVLLFLVRLAIQNDTDGKKVVDALKIATLLLHLLPDGVDALGTAFHVELETCSLQLLFNRTDEVGDIEVTRTLRFVQLVLDHVVGIVLQVFEREVFQFRLDEVELVCQGCIELACFLSYLAALFIGSAFLDLTHQVDTVGNDDEDDAHVFGKGKQEVAEVLGFDAGVAGIELVDLGYSVENGCYLVAKLLASPCYT